MNPNEVINGLYGMVYDEDGKEMSSTQSFETNVEYEKVAIKTAGKLMEGHKVVSASGSGSIMFLKMDTKLQSKIVANPTAKYNYIGKLADPTAKGEESALFKGVSFDSVPILGFELGELGEVELDFTFDDCEYIDTIL